MKNRKHQARSQACVLGMLALLRLFPILSTPPHTIIIALVTLVVMTRNLSSVPTMYQALCQAPLYLILTTTLWSSTTICFIWKPGELKKKKKLIIRAVWSVRLYCPNLGHSGTLAECSALLLSPIVLCQTQKSPSPSPFSHPSPHLSWITS